jgi:hypothetical protein
VNILFILLLTKGPLTPQNFMKQTQPCGSHAVN